MALPSLRQGEETVDNSARRACVRVLAARAPYAPAWRAGRPREARYACRYTGGQVRAVRRSPPSCGVRGLCSLSLPLSLSLSLSPSPSLCQSDPPSPPAPRPSPCSGTSPRRLSHLIQWPIRPAAGSGAAAPRRRCWSAGRRSPRGGGGSWRTCRAVRAGARARARAPIAWLFGRGSLGRARFVVGLDPVGLDPVGLDPWPRATRLDGSPRQRAAPCLGQPVARRGRSARAAVFARACNVRGRPRGQAFSRARVRVSTGAAARRGSGAAGRAGRAGAVGSQGGC